MNDKHYILSVNGEPVYACSDESIWRKKAEYIKNDGLYIIFKDDGHFEIRHFNHLCDVLTKSFYVNVR
jgi:hypothetical protein